MGRLPSTQPLPGLTPPSPQSTMTSRLIRSLPPTWPTARTLLPPRPSFRLLSTLPWQEVWLPSRPPTPPLCWHPLRCLCPQCPPCPQYLLRLPLRCCWTPIQRCWVFRLSLCWSACHCRHQNRLRRQQRAIKIPFKLSTDCQSEKLQ